MSTVPIIDLKHAPDEVGGCADGAVARLLDVTDHPKIEKWVQFPKAVFVFLVVPGALNPARSTGGVVPGARRRVLVLFNSYLKRKKRTCLLYGLPNL